MKNLQKYKIVPNIILKPLNGFTDPIICGYVSEKGNRKRPIVEAICSCGKKTQMRMNHYKSGLIKSCGCRQARKHSQVTYSYPEYVKPETKVHIKYNDYLKRSKYNKIYFQLTLEDFKNCYTQTCSYCNVPGLFGIDRIDNKKGYVKDNIKPCCKFCNRAKHEESEEIFLDWLKRVHCLQP